MTVTVRFAPSPTGYLHIGNARTAVLNWLFALSEGGRIWLRLDDTDSERSREDFATAIIDDLVWLGLFHDEIARQSERLERYRDAAERLKTAGRLYACYETEEELERKRKRQLLRGLPPVYDREGLTLTAEDRAAHEARGRRPHWRFLLEHRSVTFEDKVRGPQAVDCASLSDPVLVRADGTFLYTLPSVVDDIDFAITHVIRGEDHVSNTAPQIQLFEALGATPPEFAHHSLLVAADGSRLSKRTGALAVRDFRDAGLEGMAVVSLAATIGSSEPIAPFQRLTDLVERFDLSRLSRAPARFDPEELRALNAKLLHERPYSAVKHRLKKLAVGGGGPFWHAVRANVEVLGEARRWWEIATGEIEPVIEDPALFAEAAALLPPEPWTDTTWREWTEAVGAATGRKGRELFMPLRLALTGLARGPELGPFLPFIGRDRAIARLTGRTPD